MNSPVRYRIHPAIGVARVGNADPSAYFLGPERPRQQVTGASDAGSAVPPFKTDGLIKRQAARFEFGNTRRTTASGRRRGRCLSTAPTLPN
jgi:hypothetical protein